MSFLPSPGELSEFLSAYHVCDKANSPSFSQNSPSLPQNSVRLSEFSSPKLRVVEHFSAVDTQTAVLVSTTEAWILAPDTQTPIFLVFWVYIADFGFSAGREKLSAIFLRCLSRKLGSQRQLRIQPYRHLPVVSCQYLRGQNYYKTLLEGIKNGTLKSATAPKRFDRTPPDGSIEPLQKVLSNPSKMFYRTLF